MNTYLWTPTCPCIILNSVRRRVASYPSCWGLGWGRCGAYSGREQRRKATGQRGWGCCWPSVELGLAGAETPNCSGWGWKEESGRTKSAAAAVAAAMFCLADHHCPTGCGGNRRYLNRLKTAWLVQLKDHKIWTSVLKYCLQILDSAASAWKE